MLAAELIALNRAHLSNYPHPSLPPSLPPLRYVFSSRRYFVLTSTALVCYASKEDRNEVRDSFTLTTDTQVVEMKTKGREGGREGGRGGEEKMDVERVEGGPE
jgi:hypothetical protein